MNTPADILFVLDASREAGLGHLRRCRVLMQEFLDRNAAVTVTGRIDGVDTDSELPAGVRYVPMPADVTAQDEARFLRSLSTGSTVIVVDHYRATIEYQEAIHELGMRWCLFDSFAQTPFLADWVIHASPSATPERYEPLRMRAETRFLLGPAFALVSREYRDARTRIRPRTTLKRLLIGFGGGDDRGATVQILRELAGMDVSGLDIDIAVGALNPNAGEIEEVSRTINAHHVNVLKAPDGLHDLLSSADCSVNAGGVISYEAAVLGVPSIIMTIAENQEENARGWSAAGAASYLGPSAQGAAIRFRSIAEQMMTGNAMIENMSKKGSAMVDGLGGDRVATELYLGVNR